MSRKRKKRRIKRPVTKPSVAPVKVPNVWQWAWSKVPNWLKPMILFLVLILLIMAFVLPIAKNAKELVGDFIDPTPMPSPMWSNPQSMHIVRVYKTINGCAHDAFILPSQIITEIVWPTSKERIVKLREYGYPISPVALAFSIIHEQASELDRVVFTSLELRIEEYRLLSEPMSLVFDIRTCASQMLPSRLGYLQISPNQKSYDVLRPRTTGPHAIGTEVAFYYLEGLGVDVNSLEPGIYELSLSGEYVFKGREYKLDPLLFSMAVPDYSEIQSVYHLQFDGQLEGPEDPTLVISELLTVTQRVYLEMEFFRYGKTAEGLQGQYTYIVNMGADIDLIDWTLARRSENVYYRFPKFILKAGSGVRIWEGDGVNTTRDLYGALDVFAKKSDSEIVIQIQDPDGNWYSQTWTD